MIDEAFTGVQGQLGTAAACRLTGRAKSNEITAFRPLLGPLDLTNRV
ncbi:hypothetical protein ABT115_14005 [Streptomyces sp. NPDC001832]